MRTPLACDEDLVQRLPLPLAQLYRRAHNAKSALERHLSAFYLWEASLKLLAAGAVVEYAEHPAPDADLAERLKNLARPALGHWWEFARRLVPVLADKGDAAFGKVRDLLLGRARDDLPRAAGLDAALCEVLRGQGGARSTVRLAELFDRLVQYRNKELGHGAAGQRPGDFYDAMGRSLLAGAAEVLGRLDVLAGRRLLHVAEVRQAAGGWLVQRYELRGESARRVEPLELARTETEKLPDAERVYLELPGAAAAPRPLHPLLTYDAETAEALFLNARRDRQRTEYLSYTTGRVLDQPQLRGEQRQLLARVLNVPVEEEQAERWAVRSQAEEPPAEPEAAPAGGRRGEFELLSELGQGGMGKVYRAWQPSLGRQVALKELLRGGDAKAEARFSREIRALGRVEHPNLVKIFTSGSEGDRWFYAMELIEGVPLSAVCDHIQSTAATTGADTRTWRSSLSAAYLKARQAEKPLSRDEVEVAPRDTAAARPPLTPGPGRVAQVVELVRQAAGAAHALHEAGIVHRDIKPGNVLVTADGGQAVLMDLGLAQLADDEEGRLTRTRQFVGTLRYASPEQVLAVRRLDRRSDVCGLGATLWELLTLRPLFGATDQTPTPRLMEAIQYAEPERPRKYCPGLPADLEAIVLKCLEKDPARRYATAAELADDLGRWQRGEPVTAHPLTLTYLLGKVVRRHRGRLAVAGCLLLAALAGAAVAFYRVDVARRQAEAAVAKADEAERERARALVKALLEAEPASVPLLLKELQPFRREVAPDVRDQLRRKELSGPQRVRANLLLLPDDPGLLPSLRDSLLHAEPEDVLSIRRALRPYRDELNAGLWKTLEDRAAGEDERLRAACALAEFDPDGKRWQGVAQDVASALASQDPLALGPWMEALRPARRALLPALLRLYRQEGNGERRYVLANLLADYAADRPAELAGLIQDADAPQFAVLLPALRAHAREAAALLSEALGRSVSPQWADDRPLSSWPSPDPALVRKVEAAQGLAAERFALVQTMPLADFLAAAEGLRAAGYRPIRFRPYAAGGAVLVAAVWRRDGQDWRLASGLSAAAMGARDAAWRGKGYEPADVAGYGVPGATDGRAERYAGLWVRSPEERPRTRMFVGQAYGQQLRLPQDMFAAHHAALTLPEVVGPDGAYRYSSVWQKSSKPADGRTTPGVPEWFYETLLSPSNLQLDVCLTRGSARAAAGPRPVAPFTLGLNDQAYGPAVLQGVVSALRPGIAAFNQGSDRDAVAALSAAISRFGVLPAAHDFRAMAHARLGEAAAARWDLFQARVHVARVLGWLNPENRLHTTGLHAYADVVASAYLGEDEPAVKRLEAFVAEKAQNPQVLFWAARAYARASEAMLRGPSRPAGQKERAGRYADRAVALVERAVAHGLEASGADLRVEPDLAPVRAHPGFEALLGRLHAGRRYNAVWHAGAADHVWQACHGLAPAAHLERCRELAARGYRPAALAVACTTDGGQPVTASLWHRPVVPEGAADALARRQSNAALALLRLSQPARVWPLLRRRPDPRLRSYLIHGCGPRDVDPALLVDRLRQEDDAGARQALILALGTYADDPAAGLPPSLTAQLLQAYANDPDPGVHGAADWLLRRRGLGAERERLDRGLASRGPGAARGWYINSQGQTLTVVRGPVDFLMGSPGYEQDRQAEEVQHPVHIGRRFAIAAKTITAAQFRRFNPDFQNDRRFAPADGGPALGVTWYQAARYCRWLSEQEGVPEDQMCFPPPGQIRPGMVLPPDYLKRTGYRLPTEAEWECACRAGTVTARCYGNDRRLLRHYAWYRDNGRDRAWPVGRLKPNDWGLFDMQGNAGQWCMDLPAEPYGALPGGRAVEDSPSPEAGGYRRVRGGSFLSWPFQVRCAVRFSFPAANAYTDVGFRVARTLPAP
jgi:serine/threonine protein kinase/formylglycine-generating enzyme required for sulfatase activity